jgi:hypothetical protein
MPDTCVEFNLSGRIESWCAKDMYCPNCGAVSVWQMQDPYIAQEERPNLCIECRCCFYLSAIREAPDVKNEARRTEILKARGNVHTKPWLIYKRTAEK